MTALSVKRERVKVIGCRKNQAEIEWSMMPPSIPRPSEAYAFALQRLRLYLTKNASSEVHSTSPALPSSVWNEVLKARSGAEKEFLQAGTRRPLQTMPFFDWNEHGSLHSPASDDLRALFESRVEQLAEPRFCVLYLPYCHRNSDLALATH